MENAMRTQSIMTAKEEHDLKTVFAKIVSSRLDEPITGVNNPSQFVISRSPNYDGLIDVNFKRSVISTFMEATCLEVNKQSISAIKYEIDHFPPLSRILCICIEHGCQHISEPREPEEQTALPDDRGVQSVPPRQRLQHAHGEAVPAGERTIQVSGGI